MLIERYDVKVAGFSESKNTRLPVKFEFHINNE